MIVRGTCCALFGLALAYFISPVAEAAVITFDEPAVSAGYAPPPFDNRSPQGSILSNQYADQGILISMANPAHGAAYVTSSTYYSSIIRPTNVFSVATFASQPEAVASVTFVDPTDPLVAGTVAGSSISFYVEDGNIQATRVRIRTFDLLGSMLEERVLTTLSNTFSFSSGNVARVDFVDIGGDGHVVDNFTFGTITPVPEPASLALMAAGGTLVMWRRQRRQ